MTASEKKVLFVLVEGISDMISLKYSFESAFPDKRVMVEAYKGDITTQRSVNASNIEERIYEEMWHRLRQTSLDFDDVCEIIHIIDTDAAYIEDKRVIQEESRQHPFYDSDKCVIRTRNKFGIEKRNEQKREVVDCLVECDDLFGIPYRVFYMSCNLDHVLHDNPNTCQDMKTRKSKQFALRYKDDLAGFIRFMTESPFSDAGEYHKSWDRLRFDDAGKNSIRQATNLGIVFEDAPQ